MTGEGWGFAPDPGKAAAIGPRRTVGGALANLVSSMRWDRKTEARIPTFQMDSLNAGI